MRWFTCTPVAFGGGADFFSRDSGLLCRGFQALGIESRAVMPLPGGPEDQADLIRTEYRNLESADWWRSLLLDGVVLYAWGRPKFRKVAAAIRRAGIFLVLNQDNGGLVSPLAGFGEWWKEQRILAGQGRGWRSQGRFLKLVLRGLSFELAVTDPLRAAHLRQGDVIACVSPKAAGYYRKLCRRYGGVSLAERVETIPHAVEPCLRYSGETKSRQVVCVGRWQDVVQKRSWLLIEVIGGLVAADDRVAVEIVGTVTPELENWHCGLTKECQNRVRLRGRVDRAVLGEILGESQVLYSSSAFESFGIAAAEALCCGCSVVAGRSVSMASFEWFVSEDAGVLAASDDLAGHLQALKDELESWERGQRNPTRISQTWCGRLHADEVARRILNLSNQERTPSECTSRSSRRI